jgi:hypothetical protein
MRKSTAIGIIVLAAGAAVLSGCSPSSPTSQPSSMAEQQRRALEDPYGYTPDLKSSDMTVSGRPGFDKEGFNRDKDYVLNP